jgi:hypothetical protein
MKNKHKPFTFLQKMSREEKKFKKIIAHNGLQVGIRFNGAYLLLSDGTDY